MVRGRKLPLKALGLLLLLGEASLARASVTITHQPESQSIAVGDSATFCVEANGGPGPLTYQWRMGGFDISGATDTCHTVEDAVLGDAGEYDVVITGSFPTVISDTATLSVGLPEATLLLAMGNNSRAAEDCVQPGSATNETLIVDIRMEDSNKTVVGGQFFLQYDAGLLQFLTAVPGDPPFTQEIFENVDTGLGLITYLVGIENNGSGTAIDRTMARLYFQAQSEDCGTTSLVRFTPHAPPTRLAGEDFSDVLSQKIDIAPLALDASAPFIIGLTLSGGEVDASCGYTATFSAALLDNCSIQTSDVDVSAMTIGGAATLGSPSVIMIQVDPATILLSGSVEVSMLQDCPVTIQVSVDAVDECGNAATESAVAEVDDNQPPTVTAPPDIALAVDAGECEVAPVTMPQATASDNCEATPTITFTRSDGKPGLLDPYNFADAPITITWQAEDPCGNTGTDTQVVTLTGNPANCPGIAQITLEPDFECLQPGSGTNETLVVNVRMESFNPTIVGGQFFIEYDAALLDFVTATPGDAPFTREIFEQVDEPLGRITYLVGIENNSTGTAADTTMARLYFQGVAEDCASTPQVRLMEFDPDSGVIPTRLSDDNNGPAYGYLVDLPPVTIDFTSPLITGLTVAGGDVDALCEHTVTFSAFVLDNCSIQTPDVTVTVTLPTGNAVLGPPTVNLTQLDALTISITGSVLVSDVENCPATVQVQIDVADDCGNPASDQQSADVNDTTRPVVQSVIATGGNTDSVCQYTVTFTATVTDNCFLDAADVTAVVSLTTGNAVLGAPTISYIQTDARTVDITGAVLVSDVENCPATVQVTVDAIDDCGNDAIQGIDTADVTDATSPVVDVIAATGGVTDASCQFMVTFSATLSDNCFVDTADVTVSVTLPTSNAVLGPPTISYIQTDARTVDITGSVLVSDVENCPATVRVTVNAMDDCGNAAVTAQTSADVNDVSAPVIDNVAATGDDVDGACEFTVTFSARVTDNCFIDAADVLVNVSLPTGNATLGPPTISRIQTNALTVDVTGSVLVSAVQDCPATVQVTVNAADDCGNSANMAQTVANVNDTIAPMISGLALTGGVVDNDCEFSLTFSAIVTDNCFQDTSDVSVTAIIASGAATLAAPIYTVSVLDAQTVEVSGSVLLSAISDCPATVELTIDAGDDCSNSTSESDSAQVTDDVSPVVTAPADISVHSDAGGCEADLTTTGYATAVDNCIAGMTLGFSRSDGKPNLLDPYEAADSPVTITWTAEDDCGNTGTDTQVITVSDQNEILADLELQGRLDDTNGPGAGGILQRCITFNLWQCPPDVTPTAVVSQEVIFPTDQGFPHLSPDVSVLVPCGFAYTCMTARDRLHTLRSTAPDFSDTGTTYHATFVGNRATGGHWLVGGNLNDDSFIDILDFGTFVIRFQDFLGAGDTTCATPFFHPDISGDGLVFTGDFTFIQVNILKFHEPNCCGRPALDGSSPSTSREDSPFAASRQIVPGEIVPVTSIAVSELWRLGMGELAAADLNGDGVLDMADMDAFAASIGADHPIPNPRSGRGDQKRQP